MGIVLILSRLPGWEWEPFSFSTSSPVDSQQAGPVDSQERRAVEKTPYFKSALYTAFPLVSNFFLYHFSVSLKFFLYHFFASPLSFSSKFYYRA
jgi:hypothetical protein